MKIIVIKSNLVEGLSVVEKSKGDNVNLPILSNVLFETLDNTIKLTSTNLETAITYFVPSKVIDGGRITVPLNIILNIINNLSSERINIETKDNKLEIKTDNYSAVINCMPPDDFPIIPKIKNDKECIELKADTLKQSLLQVVSSSQFSDLRPELNSVFTNYLIDSIKLASTDSFRLSEKTINQNNFNSSFENKFSMLVPLKTIHNLTRVLKDKENIKIYRDENQVLFKTEKLEFISRLINGTFPEYENLIPKKFNTEIITDKNELINALKLTGILSGKVYEVKIKIPDKSKNIEVYSTDKSIGENRYLIPAKISSEQKTSVSFNWKYLLDGFKAIEEDKVFIGINEENKPVLIKSPNDLSYFYIIMPILKA